MQMDMARYPNGQSVKRLSILSIDEGDESG